jgi:predicted RNA-binding protein Jag
MGLRPKLELKEAADGGISIAVQLDGEVPGVQPGKRSHVLDALQFLANKIVNRPGSERRWISIGIGGHPETRTREVRRPTVESPSAAGPASSPAARGAPQKNGPLPSAAPKPAEDDERSLVPTEDADLAVAARALAEKAGSRGHFFAIVGMKREDRARVLRATGGIAGVKIAAEGVGRNRRLVFTPENPTPVVKASLPMAEEEEQEG